jgi:tetratricopeptide (TPR) repeat protein
MTSKLERLLRLVEKRPRDAELRQKLGKCYRELVRFEEAREAWEEALRLDPCDPWTHLYLGNYDYAQGDYPAAIERFRYAADLMPDGPAPFWCLADVFAAQGQPERAEAYYRKAIEIAPDDRQATRIYRNWCRVARPPDDQGELIDRTAAPRRAGPTRSLEGSRCRDRRRAV